MQIRFENVTKRYGKVEALRGVSTDIASGSRVALIGPNGSGKSTLLRALLGLVRHGGLVRLDGMSAAALEGGDRAAIAYVPQIAPQFAVPVRDLVQLIGDVRGIDAARVGAMADRLELSLDPILDRPFRALSGGMKQKLLLALALAARPRLLVLDEPTASLDSRARACFFAALAEVPRETTVFLCSHRLEELRTLVDHVLELAEGRVAYDGTVGALLERRGASVIEICARGDEAAAWLRAHGFSTTGRGWWVRAVRVGEKLELVQSALGALGDGLVDLSARDLDAIELSESRPPEAPHA